MLDTSQETENIGKFFSFELRTLTRTLINKRRAMVFTVVHMRHQKIIL